MNKKQIENLVHRMVSKISLELLDIFKNEDCFQVIEKFSKSKIFEKLFDFETELWRESPDYIIECYLEESGELDLLKEFRGKNYD